MRSLLAAVFGTILVAMLAITVRASLDRSVFAVGPMLHDPWFQATLADAYFGFITFYVWVAYKETGWVSRVVWFVLIMSLGNMAMAVYVLIQLARLRPGEDVSRLLLRSQPARAG